VSAQRLDDLLDPGARVDFMKIDVEGAAAVALRGASRILDDQRPVIYIELHGPDEQAGVRDELLSRGYVARRLDGTDVGDPTTAWSTPLVCSVEAPAS
jgi:hypothetical protein